jgi:hypothetical protein
LRSAGNPQVFQLNEIIFGACNFDVTKEMVTSSLRSQNKIPLDSSLEMLIKQRSFFPILSSNCNSDDIDKIEKVITLDQRKYKNLRMEPIPDVVITTSSMNPFLKKINCTLFINPGSLIKGSNLGNVAKIVINSPSVKLSIKII